MAEIQAHLQQFGPDPDALVFTGVKGGPLRRAFFGVEWRKAVDKAGMKGFHFHDLRHTGNTVAAATGASTKELTARMGHRSSRAALIYQHATRDRGRVIATKLSKMVELAGGQDSS